MTARKTTGAPKFGDIVQMKKSLGVVIADSPYPVAAPLAQSSDTLLDRSDVAFDPSEFFVRLPPTQPGRLRLVYAERLAGDARSIGRTAKSLKARVDVTIRRVREALAVEKKQPRRVR